MDSTVREALNFGRTRQASRSCCEEEAFWLNRLLRSRGAGGESVARRKEGQQQNQGAERTAGGRFGWAREVRPRRGLGLRPSALDPLPGSEGTLTGKVSGLGGFAGGSPVPFTSTPRGTQRTPLVLRVTHTESFVLGGTTELRSSQPRSPPQAL